MVRFFVYLYFLVNFLSAKTNKVIILAGLRGDAVTLNGEKASPFERLEESLSMARKPRHLNPSGTTYIKRISNGSLLIFTLMAFVFIL